MRLVNFKLDLRLSLFKFNSNSPSTEQCFCVEVFQVRKFWLIKVRWVNPTINFFFFYSFDCIVIISILSSHILNLHSILVRHNFLRFIIFLSQAPRSIISTITHNLTNFLFNNSSVSNRSYNFFFNYFISTCIYALLCIFVTLLPN